MFTGLIEDIGRVESIAVAGREERRMVIATRLAAEDLPVGASLAIDGVSVAKQNLTYLRGKRDREVYLLIDERLVGKE